MKKSILIVDDDLTICLMLKSWLLKNNYKVVTTSEVNEAKQLVRDNPFDLILSDINMPDIDGLSFLTWVKRYDSDILVIMMTGYAEIESVVEAMKLGAADYISKPIAPDLLFKKIEEAFRLQDSVKQNNHNLNNFLLPPGEEYRRLLKCLSEVAENNTHLLILGDRGVGKTSCVQFIFEKGHNHLRPLITLDASDLDSANQYNDLEKAAILTEKFKSAAGGIFYISSIGELNKLLQNDLLNLMMKQSRNDSFIQVILSSEKTIEELKVCFIPKLFNHLMENEESLIKLPSINGSKEHILFFASHFLGFANYILDKQIEGIDSAMQEKFVSHVWKGNIQELKNTIIKAALLTEGKYITTDIAADLFGNGSTFTETQKMLNIDSLRKENYEKEKIDQALKLAKGNKTMAASILNIDRKTLYNKIKLYNVTL